MVIVQRADIAAVTCVAILISRPRRLTSPTVHGVLPYPAQNYCVCGLFVTVPPTDCISCDRTQSLPSDLYLFLLSEAIPTSEPVDSGTGGSAACIGQLKYDGTRAETRFCLSAKWTSPFKSAGGVSSVAYWQPRCAHQR